MRLKHLQLMLILLVLLVVGGIEWQQYVAGKKALAEIYTIRLKSLMHDKSNLIRKEIESSREEVPVSLRSLINTTKILHDFVKEAGMANESTVTYSTDKKEIGHAFEHPPVMLDAFSPEMFFSKRNVGIQVVHFIDGTKRFDTFYVTLNPYALKKEFEQNFLRGNLMMMIIILTFLLIYIAIIHNLVLQPINRLSAALQKPGESLKALPPLFLSELQYLKERFTATMDDIKSQEELFRTLFESAPDAIVLLDIETNSIALYNRQALAMLGYKDSEFRSLSVFDITTMAPEKFNAKTAETKQHIYATYEDRFKKRNGELIDVRVIRRYLPMNGKEYCLCIWHNVTEEHKELKRRLLASSVLENTQEAIMILGTDRKIISVNRAFVSLFGYAPEEVMGRDPHMLSSSKHTKAFYQNLYGRLEHNGHWSGEIIDRKKSGEVVSLWANLTAVKDERGTLINYLAVYSDISELKAVREHLEYLSRHDTLTGLINKNTFDLVLEHAMVQAKQHRSQFAVLLIDIDDFKDINDTYGHSAGDQFLVQVANILQKLTPTGNEIARVGGDEFIISFEEIDNIPFFLDQLYNRCTTPIHVQENLYYVSLSIGVAIFPQDGTSVDALVKNADAAMYKAKTSGKNRYMFYRKAMTETVSQKIELEKRIHHALEEGEFTVYYQPQLSLADGHVTGVEALIRWPHPKEGMIPPDRFIPVAEQSNLIDAIGLYVLKQACRDFARLAEKGLCSGSLAVNVSSRQLQSGTLKNSLETILDESGLDPKQLELEVTEGVLLKNPQEVTVFFNELRERGITIAIDDFGTGYSSLSYLNTLPIDKLKIDKSFIDGITTDNGSRSICQTVVAIGTALGIHTIAEGVETAAQLKLLKQMGCDEIQGFYLAKPMPIDALEAFLLERA